MLSTQDLRNKEVINIFDGKSLGFVYDIEVNLEKGIIEGIIVPTQRGFFRFFGRGDQDQIIRWKDIRRIGDDVILVDVAGLYDSEPVYERDNISNIRDIYSATEREEKPEEKIRPKEDESI